MSQNKSSAAVVNNALRVKSSLGIQHYIMMIHVKKIQYGVLSITSHSTLPKNVVHLTACAFIRS